MLKPALIKVKPGVTLFTASITHVMLSSGIHRVTAHSLL